MKKSTAMLTISTSVISDTREHCINDTRNNSHRANTTTLLVINSLEVRDPHHGRSLRGHTLISPADTDVSWTNLDARHVDPLDVEVRPCSHWKRDGRDLLVLFGCRRSRPKRSCKNALRTRCDRGGPLIGVRDAPSIEFPFSSPSFRCSDGPNCTQAETGAGTKVAGAVNIGGQRFRASLVRT